MKTLFGISSHVFRYGLTRSIRWEPVAGISMLGLLFLLGGCHSDPGIKKQKYLESGKRYSVQGKYREAAIQYANALKIDRGFADAHYELAKVYLHLGQLSPAYGELSRTVDLQPTNYPARVDLAGLLLVAGKADEAKAQADAVMAAEPSNADAHALMSRIAFRNGQRDQALAEMQLALKLEPKRAAFHEQLAVLKSADPANAAFVELELKNAISLDPKSARPRLLLVAFYAGHHRSAEAEQTARDAITADPNSLAARESLAEIYLHNNDQAKAEIVLRQASKDLSDDPSGVRVLADYYERSGQRDKAKREFEVLASKHPNDLALQEVYVRSLLEGIDYEKAQSVIAGLMKKHRKNPRILALNGIVLLNGGKTDDAISALQNAINDYPNDPFMQFWLGKAALAKGELNLAEKSFRQVTSTGPLGLRARQELAFMAMQNGDVSLLSEVAEKTIQATPHFADAYVWRSAAEIARNSTDRAEADLQTAIKLAPSNAAAYLQLGALRFSQKKFPDGVNLLERALQNDPDSVQALRLLVNYELLQKHTAMAMSRLNQQIVKRPANSGFYDLLAEYQVQVKDLDHALASAEKAFQMNPNDGQAVILIARIQAQNGRTTGAIAAWERWLSAHPRDAAALAILGVLEESAGKQTKAEEYYRKSLEIQPEQPVAANNLAYLMLTRGEAIDMALTLAQTARRRMPNSPNTADTLAWAYYHKETYGFARDLLEEAARTDASNQAIQYHLGMVYRELKDNISAANHLKKAISLAPNTPIANSAKAALDRVG